MSFECTYVGSIKHNGTTSSVGWFLTDEFQTEHTLSQVYVIYDNPHARLWDVSNDATTSLFRILHRHLYVEYLS